MKADRFNLLIDLGNDAMQTRSHVARALRAVAKQLERSDKPHLHTGNASKIHDENGNPVGRWWAEHEDVIHLLTTRGETSECGEAGALDADINFVTCDKCIESHNQNSAEEAG